MEQFEIERTDSKTLRFTGELIAKAATSPDRAHGMYWSGSPGRWQELALYRTQAGQWIAHRADLSQWDGERGHSEAAVCADLADVERFLGHGRLAQYLYHGAGIDTAEDVA
jgi:hypothetical protein